MARLTSKTKHGGSRTPEYCAWQSMHRRCSNSWRRGYENYGGRGIRVCDRWEHFPPFLADMGPRPGREYSLDRIDNNGDYTPENCRWATKTEQQRNNRRCRLDPEIVGQIREMAQHGQSYTGIAKHFGINAAYVSCVVRGLYWSDVP